VSAEHQVYLDVMPNRSFSSAKKMQGECRTSSLLGCYAEPQLFFCKVTHIIVRLQPIKDLVDMVKEEVTKFHTN